MARVSQRVNYYNFSGGKVSDINPLTPPENVVRTLLNVDVNPDGSVTRRLGLEPEGGFNFPYDPGNSPANVAEVTSGFTVDQLKEMGLDVYVWSTVDFDPDLNFVVVRINDHLLFYKPSAVNISNFLLHIIDISEYRTNNTLVGLQNSFQAVGGKGLLVCSGNGYNPFYVKYDSDTDQWSTDVIQIRIRDFEGVDDGYEVNERPYAPDYNNHNTISDRHLYNLLNQGWARWEIDSFHYQTGRWGGWGVYPSNSDVASLCRVFGGGSHAEFVANRITVAPISTGRAPMGHFIIDPFDTTSRGQVASNEAGVGHKFSVGGEVITERPQCVAFFAGRFFYGSVNGVVYYSKIVEGVDDLGKCYQENDPTSADFNQLLDTDGGTIKVHNIGVVQRMVPMGNSLILLGTNGIYAISGGADKGFTANTQQVGFLSNVAALGYKSVVHTNGPLLFWSDRGIFAIVSNELGEPQIQSLSDNRISKDYNRIPIAAKLAAQGTFDPINNRVYWCYNSSTEDLLDEVSFRYTDVLVLDLNTGAFWDYSLSQEGFTGLNDPFPMMAGGFTSPARVTTTLHEDVTDNSLITVTTDSGDAVTVDRSFYTKSESNFTTLLMIPSSGGVYYPTFGKFSSKTFTDWSKLLAEEIEENPNTGYPDWPEVTHLPGSYDSVVETLAQTLGEPSVKKQSPYLYTYYASQRDRGYEVYDPTGAGSAGGGGTQPPIPVPSIWPPPIFETVPEGWPTGELYYDISSSLYWEPNTQVYILASNDTTNVPYPNTPMPAYLVEEKDGVWTFSINPSYAEEYLLIGPGGSSGREGYGRGTNTGTIVPPHNTSGLYQFGSGPGAGIKTATDSLSLRSKGNWLANLTAADWVKGVYIDFETFVSAPLPGIVPNKMGTLATVAQLMRVTYGESDREAGTANESLNNGGTTKSTVSFTPSCVFPYTYATVGSTNGGRANIGASLATFNPSTDQLVIRVNTIPAGGYQTGLNTGIGVRIKRIGLALTGT